MRREHRFLACGCLGGLTAGFGLGALLMLMVLGIQEFERQEREARAEHFATTPIAASSDPEIADALEALRAEHQMPALAAAIVYVGKPPRTAAVGVRKLGEEVPVTLDDLWHLGSNTKAMTGALAGILVEEGILAWDTTVGEVFPDLPRTESPGLPDATLAQLLSHYAGLPRNLPRSQVSREGTPVDQRLAALHSANENGLESPPGEKHAYSNLGYAVAGAMMEKATDTPWEELITNRLFAPLGMESCGFGGTGTPGEIDEPWPHLPNGEPAPKNGPEMDNPPIFGPGGRVHCTLADWAKFVQDQLRGARGEQGLLKPDTYRAIQTPPTGGEYAFGWAVSERNWADGNTLNHLGSNTMNTSNVWLAPARGFAVLVCTNQGDDAAFKATDAVVGEMLNLVEREAG